MTEQQLQWLRYMLREAEELSASYEAQLEYTEEFARWNLPDEVGMSWIAAKDMGIVENLERSGILPRQITDIMNEITDRFDWAFELPRQQMEDIYSHAAMAGAQGASAEGLTFWCQQRQAAQALLPWLRGALETPVP